VTSASFGFAIAFTLEEESYQDTAVDLGDGAGLTKYGITARSHPTVDIAALTLPEAVAIYSREYWAPLNLDLLSRRVAVAVFDGAVNHGATTSAKMLQTALGVAVDGDVGPLTAEAARRPEALGLYCSARAMRYHERLTTLAQNPATLQQVARFGPVWYRRLLACYAYCQGIPA
jgi:lysozyme family protein